MSVDVIKMFPQRPETPIAYVVYDDTHIAEAGFEIAMFWGTEYLDENVTIVTFKDNEDMKLTGYEVYIDPLVMQYKGSWLN